MDVVIITGRSGSGKSTALNVLEDAGFTCIDNIPPGLILNLVQYSENRSLNRKLAISVDVRSSIPELLALPSVIESLDTGEHSLSLVYLDADSNTLRRRFDETRRRHPLTNQEVDLGSALQLEFDSLKTLREIAQHYVDTTHLTPDLLKQKLVGQLQLASEGQLLLQLQSFGFKYGPPIDADYLFDVRCLPNPYWVPELRAFNGTQDPVKNYLKEQPSVTRMIDSIYTFVSDWLPEIRKGSRCYLTIGVGCTGGQHRSVYVAETLETRFCEIHPHTAVKHREIDK